MPCPEASAEALRGERSAEPPAEAPSRRVDERIYELGEGTKANRADRLRKDGSDRTAHTPEGTFEATDPQKLEQVGQTTLLALTVLSREVEY